MHKKILIIIPYFGKLPVYFPLFLNSVKNNPNLDFLFLHDGVIPESWLLQNFKARYFTIEDFNALASRKLEFDIKLTNGYKLCDLKTLYGFIWSDDLKGYDYWGTSDIDLILGDTSFFLNNILQSDYDVINLRDDYFATSFFLFKNSETCISLFASQDGWEYVLKNKDYVAFDEYSNKWDLPAETNKWTYPYAYPNMTTIIYRAELAGRITIYKKKLIKESIQKGEILLVEGKTIRSLKTNESYFHYHYITEKRKKRLFKYPQWQRMPSKFYITKAGFFDFTHFTKNKVYLITKVKVISYILTSLPFTILNKFLRKLF